MPKVIEPGKKEFIGNCSRCGCKFSYTLEELKPMYPHKFIYCPDCGAEYYHPDQFNSSNETLGDWALKDGIDDSLKIFKQFSEEKSVDGSDRYPTTARSCQW